MVRWRLRASRRGPPCPRRGAVRVPPSLRDAAADLRPGRDNRLIGLLSALAPERHPDHGKIVAAAEAANRKLDEVTTIQVARTQIAERLEGMTGRGHFAQKSGLAFDDPRFDRVVGSLRAKIGELAALEMGENGLGFNNLLYMAVLLAALADAPDDEEPTLRVLLVEEPEAHLHPQLQDLLMHFLESEAGGSTQVVVTTHSPNFASAARVERLTVLARPAKAELPEARLPSCFGLEQRQLAYLRRFLDVTKAALFFARGVILVEGVAEQLLIPVIAERLERPLAPNGVAVINVGGVAFPPFTDLFAPDRLPYHLAVITDSDGQPEAGEVEDAPAALGRRAAGLEERAGGNVRVLVVRRTLEWDLAAEGNAQLMLEALGEAKPTVACALAEEITGQPPENAAEAILKKVAGVKGPFAQALAELVTDSNRALEVPGYLREAIEWVTEKAPQADEPERA